MVAYELVKMKTEIFFYGHILEWKQQRSAERRKRAFEKLWKLSN